MASKATPRAGSQSSSEVELQPDAWERFERAVKTVAKSPPQHRLTPKPQAERRTAGRQTKERRD